MAGGLKAIAEGVALTAIGSALGGASAARLAADRPRRRPAAPLHRRARIRKLSTSGRRTAAQAAPQNQQTQHLVQLNIQSNDSHIVKVVQSNIQQNGVLRVAVKQNG